MVDPNISSIGSLGGSQPVDKSAPLDSPKKSADNGIAFKALLEKLQTQASELEKDSERVDGVEQLADAVDRAQASLNDALSLSEELLEAYRRALLQPGSGAEPEK